MRTHILIAALATTLMPSDARSATSGETEVEDTAPIIVEGQRSSYGAKSTATATKTDTPIRDIPQAMTVISKAQIDDQQLRSIGDLLTFVPGASPATA